MKKLNSGNRMKETVGMKAMTFAVLLVLLLLSAATANAALTVSYNATAAGGSVALDTRYEEIGASTAILYRLDAESTYAKNIKLQHNLEAGNGNATIGAENLMVVAADDSHIISSSSYHERGLAARVINRTSLEVAGSGVKTGMQSGRIETGMRIETGTLIHGAEINCEQGMVEVRYTEQQLPDSTLTHRMRMTGSGYNLTYLAEWHALPGAAPLPGWNLTEASRLCIWPVETIYPFPFKR